MVCAHTKKFIENKLHLLFPPDCNWFNWLVTYNIQHWNTDRAVDVLAALYNEQHIVCALRISYISLCFKFPSSLLTALPIHLPSPNFIVFHRYCQYQINIDCVCVALFCRFSIPFHFQLITLWTDELSLIVGFRTTDEFYRVTTQWKHTHYQFMVSGILLYNMLTVHISMYRWNEFDISSF